MAGEVIAGFIEEFQNYNKRNLPLSSRSENINGSVPWPFPLRVGSGYSWQQGWSYVHRDEYFEY
jgi:hypothetical protein